MIILKDFFHYMENVNSGLWINVHEQSGLSADIYENSYPSPQLCRFYEHHLVPYADFTSRDCLTWLEYGCASGSALTLLLNHDSLIQTVNLVDVSPMVTRVASRNINQALSRTIQINEYVPTDCRLAVEDYSVDIVNAESSLYYNYYHDLKRYIHDIYRLLRRGGICRFVLKTDQDRYAKNEWKISDFSYRINLPGHWEDGMFVTCLPYSCLHDLFSKFSKVYIGREEYSYIDLVNIKSFWIVTVYK